MCRIEDLSRKDVININDGSRLGNVQDVEIDVCEGKICSVVIYGRCRFFGLFGREEDIIVPWENIQKIGEDAILVDCDNIVPSPPPKHKGFFGR